MSYQTIAWDVDADNIATITLNRPEAMNSFTVEMADELEAAFNRASEDDDVRAVVVTGAGKAFCAGLDLSAGGHVFGLAESQTPTLEDIQHRMDTPAHPPGVRPHGGRVPLALFNFQTPGIGAVNRSAA